MSTGDKYFTAPLAALRAGKSALQSLEIILASGIVNAGIGYRHEHDDDDFETLLDEARTAAEEAGQPARPPPRFALYSHDGTKVPNDEAARIWTASLIGAKLLGVTGGSRAQDAQSWATHHRHGEVFFRIKGTWLWNAIYTARQESGASIAAEFKPISWREFRIIAAILSAPVSKLHGFVFLGWESIQSRACGFHRKDLFQAGKAALPEHCQPLSRDQISRTTEAMEALKFYLRFRFSKGDRGGKTAYSFRHESRQKLAEAVAKYQAEYGFKQSTTADNRAKDRELCAGMQATRKPPAT